MLRSQHEFCQQVALNVFIRKIVRRKTLASSASEKAFEVRAVVHSPTFRKHVPFLLGGSLAAHCCSGWVISSKFVKKRKYAKLKIRKLYSSFADQLKSSLSAHKPSHSSRPVSTGDAETKGGKMADGLIFFPFNDLLWSLCAEGDFFFFCLCSQLPEESAAIQKILKNIGRFMPNFHSHRTF